MCLIKKRKVHFIKKGWCAMAKKLHVAGWDEESPSPAQLKEFFAQIESGRMTGKELQALLTGGHKEFLIVVDYNRSLSKMIKAGNYDWINSNITVNHFPIEGSGQQEKNFSLFHFNKAKTSEEVIVEMNKEGFSPAKIEDLLALGESQPELQKQFPIVALGSVWRDSHDDSLVPCLDWFGMRHNLDLCCFTNSWDSDYRFLAVRK